MSISIRTFGRNLFASLVACFVITAITATSHASIRWEPISSDMPAPHGAAIGESQGETLIIGGLDDAGIPIDVVRVKGTEIGRLSIARAGAATASNGTQTIVAGGRGAGGPLISVVSLTYDPAARRIAETILPDLPVALERPTLAIDGDQVYVAGTSADGMTIVAVRTTGDWRVVQSLPASVTNIVTVVQNSGDAKDLFVFGIDHYGAPRTWRYANDRWQARAAPPSSAFPGAVAAVASGQSHVLLLGSGSSFAYHTITDTWTPLDGAPAGITSAVRAVGRTTLIADGQLRRGVESSAGSRFRWPDYLALAGYPVALIVLGYLLRVRDESDNDAYFRGGKSIPWWAAGLSLVATQVSAIGFVAIPAKTFATDWTYFAGIASWFIVVPIITHYFIPLFQRMNVTTAYEYLEGRFNYPMRLTASLMFMVIQVTRAAVVLYLPAIALSAVTGIDRIWCILAMGGVTTVYTVLGGMQTVIWTDVLQAITLLGGAMLCVGIVLFNVGGVGPFLSVATADGKLDLVGHGWSATAPSLWIVLFGGVFARLASLTSDQNVVQRYQSTPNARAASRALWTDVAVSIPWAFTIFLLGTALYVYFKHNPGSLDPTMATDQIVPLFIADRVPVGLAGLIVAAIFAASLDGSMLAVATTFVNDVYGRLRPATTPRRRVLMAQLMTVILGVFATTIGVMLAVADIRSLWDFAIQMSGLFTGALAGVFILGLFCRRVGAAAAFCGLFGSAVIEYFVESRGLVHVLFYAAVGVCSSVGVALLASLFLPARRTAETIDLPPSRGSPVQS